MKIKPSVKTMCGRAAAPLLPFAVRLAALGIVDYDATVAHHGLRHLAEHHLGILLRHFEEGTVGGQVDAADFIRIGVGAGIDHDGRVDPPVLVGIELLGRGTAVLGDVVPHALL